MTECPWCGEPAETMVDGGGLSSQEYVEDCWVCCRPIRFIVERDEEDPTQWSVTALRDD